MALVRPSTQADHASVVALMSELQDHISTIDPVGLQKKKADFDSSAYCAQMLRTIEQSNGMIFVAEDAGTLLGFVAGIVHTQDEVTLLDHYPNKEGEVLELVVSSTARNTGIGSLLMTAIEQYLKEQGCSYVRTICFTPNTSAHQFYEKCGYSDRYTGMMKKL